MHHLGTLLAFITQHSTLAYGAIFLISLSESLALVGLLIPGTVIMFVTGAIVATGSLQLAPVLVMAAAGAVAGDSISYWLGHHYRERLKRIWPFSRYPGMLANGEAFFHRNGGKSVLFGRFVGPVRPVIPVVAGMLSMRPLHFAVVNVLSAVGWALVYILPGVFFGTSLAVAGAVSTRLAVLIFVLLATLWSLLWLSRKLASLLEHRGPIWLAALKNWAAADTPVRWPALPAKWLLAFLLRGRQGDELLLGLLVFTLAVAGWGFLGVLQDVLAKDPLVVADHAVYQFFQALRTSWADRVFVAVTEFGDPFVVVSLAGAVLIVLVGKRCYRAATFWALAVLGGLLGVQLLKWTLHLPRPVSIYHGAAAYGFPSGHSTMSVVLYGFLAILLARGVTGTRRWGLFSSVVVITFAIGLSRVYLGAHWLSDVLGGLFIGTSWAALLGIAYLRKPAENIPRRALGVVVALVIVFAGGWHLARCHDRDLVLYAPRHVARTMPLAAWRVDGWHALPAWRIDMEGDREQPLTIQWAGAPDDLTRYLKGRGWRPAPPWSPKNVMPRFLRPRRLKYCRSCRDFMRAELSVSGLFIRTAIGVGYCVSGRPTFTSASRRFHFSWGQSRISNAVTWPG